MASRNSTIKRDPPQNRGRPHKDCFYLLKLGNGGRAGFCTKTSPFTQANRAILRVVESELMGLALSGPHYIWVLFFRGSIGRN